MNPHDGSARPKERSLCGTRITRSLDLANPRLVGVWKWNFEEGSRLLYAIAVFAPNVLREDYPLEELQHLKDVIARQSRAVEGMIAWAQTRIAVSGLQEGEPGGTERLSADIRTPLANTYADLFVRADLAIRLLDALWLQGVLTDEAHDDRTRAMRRAPLKILGAAKHAHAHLRRCIQELYRRSTSHPL